MNIVVVGQGAIGLLWYAGLNKTLTTKLSLYSSNTTFTGIKHFTYTHLNHIEEQVLINHTRSQQLKDADLILYCVKAYQVEQALQQTINFLNKNSVIALCHNGMINIEDISQKYDIQQAIIMLLTTHASKKHAATHIQHTGNGKTDIGLLKGKLSLPEKTIANTLNQAMPDIVWHDNIRDKQWLKLAVNCVINPLTALIDIENGALIEKKYATKITRVLQEIYVVAQAVNVQLNVELLEQTVFEVINKTAKNSSSMRCDVNEKRATEIESINGYIHHLGEKYNLATPENTQLWQAVKLMEKAYK